MTQPELLNLIKQTWTDWQATLAQVSPSQMTQPGVEGHYSIKDIIAHITWYEQEMVGLLSTRTLAGSDLWNLPTHRRNAAIYDQNKDRPLPDILTQSHQTHQQLLNHLATLTDDELNHPGRFTNMPPDWLPHQLIAGNTHQHYPDHTTTLQSWLNKS